MSERKLHSLDLVKEGFKDTYRFSAAAHSFVRSGDHDDNRTYCQAPEGTSTYKDFWDEEEKRCMYGHIIDDVRITGIHYFYLNYCRIRITVEDPITKIPRKLLSFPKFLDVDYYYFHEIEKARNDGDGQIISKSRRKGFSFKNGGICAWSFTFQRESISLIGAFLERYSKQTMDMTIEMLDFNLKHTDFGKNRSVNKKELVESGFIEDGMKQGFKSQVERLTFKDNFSAAIGKTADWMLFEEAGKWPNLIDSYAVTSPVFKDGSIMTGMPIIFGTGGDMEAGSVDFSEMFYDPITYGLRPYSNVWDDAAEGMPCGLFIDDMWYKPGKIIIPKDYEHTPFAPAPTHEEILDFTKKHPEDLVTVEGVDKDGNSHRCAAEIGLNLERHEKRRGGTKRSWEKYITQYPKTPKEAFLRTSGNLFPTVELNNWLGKIETSEKYKNARMIGDLYWDEGKVKWMPNMDLYPVDKFPHRGDDDNKGCVVIWEHPYKDEAGEIPFGLYIAGTDPYDQDSSTTTSLGSTFVYKQFQTFDGTYNMIVAEYTGRPDRAEEYYENTRKLLSYYNAQDLYENQLTGLKTYFQQKKCLHLLKEQPSIISNIIKNSSVQRGYGVHMSESIKRQAEIYLRDWLLEERSSEDGDVIMNLHTIMSIPLLKELIAYDPKHGNFDRAMAMMCVILHVQENHKIQVDKVYKKASRFSNGIFQENRVLFKKRHQSKYTPR